MDEREQLQALRRLKELQDREVANMSGFEKAGRAALGKADEVGRIVAGRLNPIVALNTLATGVDARDGTFLSENAISKLQEKNKQFTEGSLPGTAASFAVEALATGPAGKLGQGVKLLGRKLGGTVLGRALTGRTAARAVEGAATEAALGNPEDVATGAVLSSSLGKLGDALGTVGKGVIKKTAEARNLEDIARQSGIDLQIPLGQSAEKGLGKTLFQKVLPVLPGAQKRALDQQTKSDDILKAIAESRGIPDFNPEDVLGPGIRVPSEIEKEASWMLLGGGLGPLTAGKSIAGAKALSTDRVQKALTGDFTFQKELSKLIKKAEPSTSAVRRAISTEDDK